MDRHREYEELTRRPIPDETMPSHDHDDDGPVSHHRATDVPPTDRERFSTLADELENDFPAVDVTKAGFSQEFAGVGCCVIPQAKVIEVIAALRSRHLPSPDKLADEIDGFGAMLAWLVEGAPERQKGIEAAARLRKAVWNMQDELAALRAARPSVQAEPWHDENPREGGDARKLCTIDRDGMIFVGIRAWSGADWLNNGVRDKTEKVLAWRDLPPPKYSDGLMSSMAAPTLPEGRL